jgi:hypothetical protein
MDSDRLAQSHSPPGADAVPATLKRKVQRHSPHRLPRQKLVLPGHITVSAEKHKGRLVVRVESPDFDDQVQDALLDDSDD